MTDYILMKGKHVARDADGVRRSFKPGDTLTLDADQAKAFGDKFKLVSVKAAEDEIKVLEQETKPEPKPEPKETKEAKSSPEASKPSTTKPS